MEEKAKKVISEVAAKGRAEQEKIEELIQLMVFVLDEEEYAAPIREIKEVINIPEIIPLPGTPESVRGILNLRGEIVAAIDLEKRFHQTREHKTEQQHVIIIQRENDFFGVIVDEVIEVLQIPVSLIKETHELSISKIHTDYVKGVIVLDNPEQYQTFEILEAEEEEDAASSSMSCPSIVISTVFPFCLARSRTTRGKYSKI